MDPITLGALISGGSSLLGGIFGGLSADSERDQQRAMINEYMRSIARQEGIAREGLDTQTGLYQPYANLAPKYLSQLESGIANGDFNQPTLGDFSYDKTAQDFLDPSLGYQQEQIRKSIEQSAVAGGGLNSGKTLRDIMGSAQKIGETGYNNAYNQMTADKSFNYQDYINHFNNQSQQVKDKYQQISNMFNTGMQGVNAISGANQNYTNSMMGAESQRGTLMGQKAGLNDQFNGKMMGIIGNTLGGIGGAASSYFGQPTQPTLPSLPTTSFQQPYQPQNLYMAQNLNSTLMPQMPQGNL